MMDELMFIMNLHNTFLTNKRIIINIMIHYFKRFYDSGITRFQAEVMFGGKK